MAEAIREFADQTGREVGLKLAGGIRTSKQALGYLAIVAETLGTDVAARPTASASAPRRLLNDIAPAAAASGAPAATRRTADLPVD